MSIILVRHTSKEGLTLAGSVVTALAASACCIGPVVFTLLGLGGAAFAVALEPYRPVFIGVTTLLLGSGFYLVYRRPRPSHAARMGHVGHLPVGPT